MTTLIEKVKLEFPRRAVRPIAAPSETLLGTSARRRIGAWRLTFWRNANGYYVRCESGAAVRWFEVV